MAYTQENIQFSESVVKYNLISLSKLINEKNRMCRTITRGTRRKEMEIKYCDLPSTVYNYTDYDIQGGPKNWHTLFCAP